MKVISIFIFVLHSSSVIFGQDTLELVNSHDFGASQQYVMNENGSFTYESRCQCTGSRSVGKGAYKETGKVLLFEFDSLWIPLSSATCINRIAADSISLFLYDALDSNQIDHFSVNDSRGYWLNSANNKIANHNIPFQVNCVFYDLIEIEPDSSCAVYRIYLQPNFRSVTNGTNRVLKKRKNEYHEIEIDKPERFMDKKRRKSIYRFQFKSVN